MASSSRVHRVADRIQVELSDIIQNRLKDPRRGFLTLTRVEVTGDLRSARVYVSSLPAEEIDDTLRTLTRARGFLRTELGGRLGIRHTPELQFLPDRSGEHVQRVAEILKDLERRGEFGDDEPKP